MVSRVHCETGWRRDGFGSFLCGCVKNKNVIHINFLFMYYIMYVIFSKAFSIITQPENWVTVVFTSTVVFVKGLCRLRKHLGCRLVDSRFKLQRGCDERWSPPGNLLSSPQPPSGSQSHPLIRKGDERGVREIPTILPPRLLHHPALPYFLSLP